MMVAQASAPPVNESFVEGVYANDQGSRHYKLFIPSHTDGKPLPLLVMLHGCLQDPDDFALGTRMNTIAAEQRIFVLYPGQSQAANQTRCWNWFNAANQRRDQGEPSIIAGMTREVIGACNIDVRRVYIAGMSAGGAMAAIVAANYSDLYAALGIHSGMLASGAPLPPRRIPLIVFHGDQDILVNARNGGQIVSQWLGDPALTGTQDTSTQSSQSNGRAFTRTRYKDGAGHAVAENWLVHDAGHAWSGGGSAGSFADASGPDASREMVKFFSSAALAARP